jgi:DNA topoisomerase-1
MSRKLRSALDPRLAAESASLRYVGADEPGLTRVKKGRGFAYVDGAGKPVTDEATLARIRGLVIPPAWRDVWICAHADGHLQAVGRDARGRKQYRYHPRWRDVRDAAKYYRLAEFCRALPRLRRQVESDLACGCLCKEKVVALVVSLLERTQLRVGNDEYARTNDSYGATTLRDRHAKISGSAVELRFRGKGGKRFRVALRDRRMAAMVRRCRELPGQRLFQYVDPSGKPAPVTSTDVNDYVRAVTGGPFTAKDFRTWAATMACATLLVAREAGTSQTARKREVRQIVEAVAEQLGNTPTVCRSSYIHPAVIEGYMEDRLPLALARKVRSVRRALGQAADADAPPTGSSFLAQVERSVLAYLEQAARRRAAATPIEPAVARRRWAHPARSGRPGAAVPARRAAA